MRCIPATPAISASGPIPKLLARVKAADLVLLIGGRLSRNAVAGLHAVRHSRAADETGARPSRAPTNSAASITRRSPSTPRRPPSARRSKACSRRTRSPGKARARRRTPIIWPGPRAATKVPGDGQSRRGHGLAARESCRRTPSSPTAPAISPAGSIASTASASTTRTSRRPPARWATACRRRSAMKTLYPERTGGLRRRRRRLPDDRAGFRHRRAIRAADHRGARRQFALRHHPHAPGARISRPRDRHRPAQSGFRRLCHGLRRLRRAGREDRRFPRRLRAGGGDGQAVDHPSQDRSGGDHAGHDAQRHPREGAQSASHERAASDLRAETERLSPLARLQDWERGSANAAGLASPA